MPYCPHCGNAVEAAVEAAAVVDREPVEVTLARIEAERAIEVARIEAGAVRAELRTAEHVAEVQADAQVEAAEAVAEIITAGDDDGEAEAEPDPEPVIIEAPAPDPEPDNAPPPVDHHQSAGKKAAGWWDAYQ